MGGDLVGSSMDICRGGGGGRRMALGEEAWPGGGMGGGIQMR